MSDNTKNIPDIKFVVPPGLISRMETFIAHYRASRGQPVMILGDTGVGKSLFLHLYMRLWEEDNPGKPVRWLNCAHLGGPNSDPNIARSELFGYDPALVGSGTAIKTAKRTSKAIDTGFGLEGTASFDRSDNPRYRPGLIDAVKDGGLLILEEIGELPEAVQAMLLTFTETGEYKGVGFIDSKKANTTIVGATNRDHVLRNDLRHRFFPFFIPPIHQRREDILYYLAFSCPELIPTLTPWEILTLLAHNWPGNVREIERVGKLLQRRRLFPSVIDDLMGEEVLHSQVDEDPVRLLKLDDRDSSLNASTIIDLHEKLKSTGLIPGYLRSLFHHHHVGLDNENQARPFSKFQNISAIEDLFPNMDRRFEVRAFKAYQPFARAYEGFLLFCSLFFQDPTSDRNCADTAEGNTMEFPFNLARLPESLRKDCRRAERQIFQYVSGIRLKRDQEIPENYSDRENFFRQLVDEHPGNRFLCSITKREPADEKSGREYPDIFSMKWNDFMQFYLNGIHRRWKTSKNVAAVLDIPKATYDSRRRKYLL